jgi:N-acetyl-gamma-glutamyl-phosphate reductase
VGIIGASGYTGVELIRLLLCHPEVEITHITSERHDGQKISEVFPSLQGWIKLKYKKLYPENLAADCQLVFMALPHLSAMPLVPILHKKGIRIIDLSTDFRLKDPQAFIQWYNCVHVCPELLNEAVYGLSEIYRSKIIEAQIVANPGCYPTGIILALAPLLKENLIDRKFIVIDSKSGISGAGRKADIEYQFCECHDALKAYQPVMHRHIPEIEQELSFLAGEELQVSFTPHLVPVSRGILNTIYVKLKREYSLKNILERYQDFYQDEPFIRLREPGSMPDTRQVVGSNCCDIGLYWDKRNKILKIISVIDNLVKGASGQAIQNMNIMYNLPEKTGLKVITVFP